MKGRALRLDRGLVCRISPSVKTQQMFPLGACISLLVNFGKNKRKQTPPPKPEANTDTQRMTGTFRGGVGMSAAALELPWVVSWTGRWMGPWRQTAESASQQS